MRICDNTPASDWLVFLDLDARAQVGQGFESTEEHAVFLAASLADRGLQQGNSVGLVAHDETLTWLPPQHGEEHRYDILRALATLSPGAYALEILLAGGRPIIRQNSSLILITPSQDTSWLEALMPLMEHGAVPTVLLLDPATYPSSGKWRDGDENLIALLSDLGITHYRITREWMDRPEVRPGKQGHWQWHEARSSRATLKNAPGHLVWRELS